LSTDINAKESGTAGFNPNRLFIASCIALITTAMTFAIRGDIMPAFAQAPFSLDETNKGFAMAGAFWGFTLAMIIGGPLCDWLGVGRLLKIAFVGHIVGIAFTIMANSFISLTVATWVIGLANGFVEAGANPLVATLYPNDKVKKLNLFHAWFPGGIVIGSLVASFIGEMGTYWQIKMATILVPAVIYGILFFGQKFPETERVQSGITTSRMFKEALNPMFLVFFFCMWLTAATELGTNQWISELLKNTAGTGILVLAWINIIMCLGRLFAGPVVHKVSPVAVLLLSALFAGIGLFLMGGAETKTMAFAASTVFAVGCCYFWPTMLGVTSERFPAGGALLLAIMGGAGMFSSGVAQPVIGGLVKSYGPAMALKYSIVLPAVLVVVFTAVYLYDKSKGGYKIVKLNQESPVEADIPAEVK
jgi:MFS family permease